MSQFTIPLESRTYHLYGVDTVTIRFFANAVQHLVEEHVLSENQPWWDRLIGVQFRKSLGQKMQSGDVSLVEAGLKEAFAQCVPILDAGIAFSIGFPVYVAFTQKRRKLGSAGWYDTQGYYFISRDGLLMIVREDILRTAFFPVGIKGGNFSKKELFGMAWKWVKDIKLHRLYRDTKGGEEYAHVALIGVAPENWRRRPKVH